MLISIKYYSTTVKKKEHYIVLASLTNTFISKASFNSQSFISLQSRKFKSAKTAISHFNRHHILKQK